MPKEPKPVYGMDAASIPFITTFLQSPVGTAGIAPFKDERENKFTSIIIHEDAEHVSRLPKEVPIRVRTGFIKARNVGLIVVMPKIHGELYETWWNYHNPIGPECFRDIMRQDKLLLVFFIDSPAPARILWVPNTLKEFFKSAIAKILGMKPWTMQEFNVARETLYREYPTPKDLWENLVDSTSAKE
ncbi:MAG: hypothetical protein ACFFDP_08995 [Promethearchaeota archaeon]